MPLTHNPFRLLAAAWLIHLSVNAQVSDTVSVYFAFNEANPLSYTSLDSAIGSLQYTERATVLGYADFVGTDAYNIGLSEKRANTVARYILRNAKGKLKVTGIKGNGELPVVNTTDTQGDSLSRRVDVIILRTVVLNDTPEETAELEIELEEGESLVLEGLNFIPGRHYPLPESRPVLISLLEAMKERPDLEIEIRGHICCNYNVEDGYDYDANDHHLSRNRAKFVFDYLVDSGIDPARMRYTGKGSSQPLVFPERTEADKQKNRRVEIAVLGP